MNNYFVQTYTWNPWRNLAVEKYLADKIEKGDVVFYLWQNEHTAVSYTHLEPPPASRK